MDTVQTSETVSPVSDNLCLRYADRGLSVSVRDDAELQIINEEKTAEQNPTAYRYSTFGEHDKNRYKTGYCNGARCMTSDDLLRYFRDGHKTQSEESAGEHALRWDGFGMVSDRTEKHASPFVAKRSDRDKNGKNLTPVSRDDKGAAQTLLSAWLQKPDVHYVQSKKRRRIPSTFVAALFVVICSMALLVGSSLLLQRQKADIVALTGQRDDNAEAAKALEAELAIKNDLYAIREIAVNSYGMIPEQYASVRFLTMTGEEQIVAYKAQKQQEVGLGAIFSAISGLGK